MDSSFPRVRNAIRTMSRRRGRATQGLRRRFSVRRACRDFDWRGQGDRARHPQGSGPQRIADRTNASVVKKLLSTAPMLMYQHSRSGVSIPGK